MTDFQWLGDNAILYKGRICPITEHDGWGVVNAMRRIDQEEQEQLERLKSEITKELRAEKIKNEHI